MRCFFVLSVAGGDHGDISMEIELMGKSRRMSFVPFWRLYLFFFFFFPTVPL